MDPKRRQRFQQLAQLMRKQSFMMFPVGQKTMEMLDLIVTDQEAEFLLKVGTRGYTEGQLAWLSGMDAASFQPFFQGLLKKGLLSFHGDEPRKRIYHLAAMVVGWVEFVLCDGQRDERRRAFARKFEELFQGVGRMNSFPQRQLVNLLGPRIIRPTIDIQATAPLDPERSARTLKLDRQVETPDQHIHPSQTVFSLLDRCGDKDPIALVHCYCRMSRELLGDTCRFHLPAEACISVGHLSRQLIEQGLGRPISRDEARQVVQVSQKRGAVHAVFHERDDLDRPEAVVCNCCWDCCGFLGNYNRGRSGINYRVHYLAELDEPQKCNGCGRCEKLCPAGAIRVRDKQVFLQPERCIGCGQCALQCNRQVFALTRSERTVFLPLLKPGEARLSADAPRSRD